MFSQPNRVTITILVFTTLLVWSLAKGGDNHQPKLQIELQVKYDG